MHGKIGLLKRIPEYAALSYVGANSLTTNQASRAHLQITQASQISPPCHGCKEKWVSHSYHPGCYIGS